MSAAASCLEDALDDLVELRPFPAAASQVIAVSDNPDATAREVIGIIKQDPALSLKVLQVANSPLYGFSGEIRTVDHAAVVLGFRTLRNLAVSMAVGEVFGSGDSMTAKARQDMWTHALSCGSIARTLATAARVANPDESFLGGIVHDVGKLFFFDYQPEHYSRIVTVDPGKNSVTAELETFGIAHPRVGQRCGQNWGLPDEINDVICFHHEPMATDFDGTLVGVVAAANQLSKLWGDVPNEDGATRTEILTSAGIELSPSEEEEFEKQALAGMIAVTEAYGLT